MQIKKEVLVGWVEALSQAIDKEEEPSPELYAHFIDSPQLSFQLIDYLDTLEEKSALEATALYSAAIFAFDICINQLHTLDDFGNKIASKTLNQLMNHMAAVIFTKKHSISFWLPLLNAFWA